MTIDSSFSGWGVAFLLTLAVEVPVWWAVARACHWGRPRVVAGAVGVNIATHPLLFAASTRMTSWPPLLVAEVAVVAVEAALMLWWLRGRDPVVVALTSLLANALSFGAGLVVTLATS